MTNLESGEWERRERGRMGVCVRERECESVRESRWWQRELIQDEREREREWDYGMGEHERE